MTAPQKPDSNPTAGRTGRPRFKPSESDRKSVQTMAAFAVPEEQIARTIGRRGISPKTLRKCFRQELSTGIALANAKLAQTLFQMATSGEHPAVTIFCAKVRLHMREKAAPVQSAPQNRPTEENYDEDFQAVANELARLAADRDTATVPGELDQTANPNPALSVEGLESPS
jgi:hypothetical protein